MENSRALNNMSPPFLYQYTQRRDREKPSAWYPGVSFPRRVGESFRQPIQQQKFLEPKDGYKQWDGNFFLGSSEETQHHTMQDTNHALLRRSKRQNYLDVSLNNRTNTKFRSSEYERDERWWYSTKKRPPSLEREGKERQRLDPQNTPVPVQYFLGPEEKEIHRRLMEREENKSQQRLMEHLRKRSELFATAVNHINSPTASTEFKHTEDFSSGEKEFYVPGSVNGITVEALPDTGAEACFISPHLTSRLGLHPTPGPQKRIKLANKKTVQSSGMVVVPWRFRKEGTTHMICCWVLPGCGSDLVLGNHFLRATNALKKVCHRIKSKFLEVPKRLSLSYLGNKKQRLRGYLNGHLIAALPDTGSDAMLINGAYARKIGLDIDSDIRNRGTIRLADGSTAIISGIVRDAEWRVGSTAVQCNFYVLENLCVNVILSNKYLFEMNIFTEQEEHFFNMNSEDDFEEDYEGYYEEGYEDYIIYFCILSIDTKTHGTYAVRRFKSFICFITDLSQRQYLNPTGTERTRKTRRDIQTR